MLFFLVVLSAKYTNIDKLKVANALILPKNRHKKKTQPDYPVAPFSVINTHPNT